MDWKATSRSSRSRRGERRIAHVIVEEVPNSQNPRNTEHEYNPFLSQSQPGPSNQDSQPGPSNQASQSVIEFTADTTFVQKRRGRPPRSSFQHLKPTRGSQRERKCTKILNYESFQDLSWQWTEKDKTLFLAGCTEVGIEDIAGLKRFLPHKTEHDIRNQIGVWKDLAARRVEKCMAEGEDICGVEAATIKNLDEWIDYFKEKAKTSEDSSVISNYFAILAEYGVFPSPEECGGIDISAMYRYIHCMINGVPPYGLNRVTTNALLTCLNNVMEKLDDPYLINNMEEQLFHQPSKPNIERFGKTYSRKGKNASAKPIDRLLSNSLINPLNLPENAVINKFEDYEDSDED